MYAGQNFPPADPGESEVYSLDFKNDLQVGEEITGVTIELSVADGSDVDVASRLSGSPSIAGTIVSHRVANLQPEVLYRFRAIADTDMGNKLSLYAHIPCEALA